MTPTVSQLLAGSVSLLVAQSALGAGGLVLEGYTGRTAPFAKGELLFSDRTYTVAEVPEALQGMVFLHGSIEWVRVRCAEPGMLYALTPTPDMDPAFSREANLLAAGFTATDLPDFQLFGTGKEHRAKLYQRPMERGEWVTLRKLVLLLAPGLEFRPMAQPNWAENTGQRLYNGIVLPTEWPPQEMDPGSTDPMPVPYLDQPPEVIPIDLGRQLFVDDFLVEKTDLTRTYHQAEKYAGNPVMVPETADEIGRDAFLFLGQGGVFYDPADGVFRMFYVAGWRGGLAMATSTDLIHWQRPDLGLAGGNLLLPPGMKWTGPALQTAGSDNCVWLDTEAVDPAERLKLMTCWMHVAPEDRPQGFNHSLHTSADGRVWSPGTPTGMADDYCSFFYNPFRQVWAFSIKQYVGRRGRARYYAENRDFRAGADWSKAVFWTGTDRLDEPEPADGYPHGGDQPQLYSLNAVAYESLMVGMHYIHRGPDNGICDRERFPKLIDLELGFSRDGFHWSRPDRRPFIAASRQEGTWDRAYLHSTAGMFLVMGDRLVFPYVGTSGVAPNGDRGMYTGGSIGLAMLRRDGFASFDAGDTPGTLTTRPVTFNGHHLFVNVDCPRGELRVEVLDRDGEMIAPFSLADCVPLTTDRTLVRVQWQNAADLARLAGQPVRFRFHLRQGSLYAFWVSRDHTGRSEGYVAAGGLGYPGPRDTVGRAVFAAVDCAHPEAAFEGLSADELKAQEKAAMRGVANLSLMPPTVNTSPLPKYDYDQLDYGMTIGIAQTLKGRLWAAWVGGEDGPKSFMVAATSDDNGETWSKPRLAIDCLSPTLPLPRSVIVGNLWTDPTGKLWFFFDQTMNHYDERQGLWATTCANPDAADPVWSAPQRIWHGAVLNKPTVLANGEWLLPVEFPNFAGIGPMRGAHPELHDLRGSNVFASTDQGQTWERRGLVRFPKPNWPEHMFVELKDGRIWMLARTGNGIMQSFSADGGRTWTEPSLPPGIKQPVARFHIRRLDSGRILLVKHGATIDSHEGRSQLTAWLSDDEGATWQGGLMLDERTGVSYPDGFQAPDGTIYISYDRNRSTDGEILLARFTEADILAGKLVDENSRLRLLISRPLKKR